MKRISKKLFDNNMHFDRILNSSLILKKQIQEKTDYSQPANLQQMF